MRQSLGVTILGFAPALHQTKVEKSKALQWAYTIQHLKAVISSVMLQASIFITASLHHGLIFEGKATAYPLKGSSREGSRPCPQIVDLGERYWQNYGIYYNCKKLHAPEKSVNYSRKSFYIIGSSLPWKP